MKSKTAQILFIIVGTLTAAALFYFTSRNHLVTLDETVQEYWHQIDTQLQRRADLVPNLVETVKGYAKHEENLFTHVAEVRSQWTQAQSPAQKAEAAEKLNTALGRLIAVKEAYPALKANENFLRLQDELAGTENRIGVARTRYNEAVKEYNSALRRIPGCWIAPRIDLTPADYYEPPNPAAAREVPAVKF